MQNIYKVEVLTRENSLIFKGLYKDFYSKAISEYRFELPPLEFEEFVDAVDEGMIKCLTLDENGFPTAFLVYTTAISESVELNLIHCLGTEDLVTKRKMLLESFLEDTKNDRKNSVVCYPMMSNQVDFAGDIAHFGFKFVGLAVLRFLFDNPESNLVFESNKPHHLGYQMRVGTWKDSYRKDAVDIIHQNFKDTSDALFDTRFKSAEGTKDIIDKVVDGIYGEFLPEATSVLLYLEKPVGFCFANVTGGKITNIPLVAINKEYRGKGFSQHLLKNTVGTIKSQVDAGLKNYTEINVTTETDNYNALKMYRNIGFKEDYSYTQAYLPIE